ncbi:MAG: Asp-tRNA(Asn)/Glu-tRNA(Gln) amidotransferase subunit GatC [Elusimicrobiota bacterium]
MALTKKDVEHVAKLARLGISEKEKEMFTSQIGAILGYIDKLNKLNTDGIKPTAQVIDSGNALREDELAEPNDNEKLLRNAPEREGSFFKVKKVIE